MKRWIMLATIALGACATDEEPAQGKAQLAEIIDVHGCRPGTWEVGEGDNWGCFDPWGGWGPASDPTDGWGDEGERVPPGAGPQPGGGGIAIFGGVDLRDVEHWKSTSNPNVSIGYSTIEGKICKIACAVLAGTVCALIADVCLTSTVVTVGTAVFACSAAVPACRYGGIPAAALCTQWICPD